MMIISEARLITTHTDTGTCDDHILPSNMLVGIRMPFWEFITKVVYVTESVPVKPLKAHLSDF